MFWTPILPFRITSGPPTRLIEFIQYGQIVWKISLLTSALGLFSRGSTALAALLGMCIIGLEQSLSDTSHSAYLTICTLLLFAFAKCGDAFSLDKQIKGNLATQNNFEYYWPIQLGRALHASLYFGSAVAKLRHGGVAWIVSDGFSVLLKQSYVLRPYPYPLTWWVSEHSILCEFLTLSTVLLELSAPLALFNRSFRRVLLPALLVLHIGIYCLMGIGFWVFAGLFIFWLPVGLKLNHRKLSPQII